MSVPAPGDGRNRRPGAGPAGLDSSGESPTGAAAASAGSLLRLGLAFYGALAAACLLWGWLRSEDLLFATPAAAHRGLRAGDVLLGAAAGLGLVWLSRLLTERTEVGTRTARALGRLLPGLGWRESLLLALASGVGEELLFRGILQPRLGLVAASLVFGLAHLAPRRELVPWTATSILAGFALGGLFEATGNLAAPVAAHAVVNALNLRWLSRRYGV